MQWVRNRTSAPPMKPWCFEIEFERRKQTGELQEVEIYRC